jgi:N-acetylmuramoyl-L-alanine amidase
MRSPQNGNRSGTVNTVIVHHTAANVNASVATFMSEKGPHYMIDTDGQVVKFVQDTRRSFHAGWSNWMGSPDVNQFSIGIEIINTNEPYAEAQYTSLLDLLRRLMQALRDIDSWNIVGHNDIATHDGSHTGQLGRKSSDPGLRFEWSRLEARQLGMLMAIGPPSPSIYVGLFTSIADLSLREGDNDKTQRFGGKVRTGLTKAAPVKELQQDLRAIGYWVGTPDGDYGGKTVAAVRMLQEHFFAGGRGHKAPDGRVDARTAALIKSVVATSPRAVASPASAGP